MTAERHLTAARDTTLCGRPYDTSASIPFDEWSRMDPCSRCRELALRLPPVERSILAVVALE